MNFIGSVGQFGCYYHFNNIKSSDLWLAVSFHLFRFFIMFYSLQCTSLTLSVKFISKYFFMLLFFSDCLLLRYRDFVYH